MSLYEILTTIAAVVSTVLSLLSIGIVVFDLVFKLGKQKFEQYYHYGFKLASYYFKPKETKTKGLVITGDSEKKISAAISVRVRNCSAYPVTIDSIYVSNDFKGKETNSYHDNAFSFEPIWEETDETGHPALTTLDVCEKVLLPITLEPYEVRAFSVQFPHFNSHVKRYGDTVYPYLHFATARKIYTIKVEVPEYHAIMSEPPRKY